MKHFLISIAFVALSFFTQSIDIAGLKKDLVLIQYKKVMKDLMDGAIEGKYPINKYPNVMKEYAKSPTKENMKKLYREAGMKNGDEYVDLVYLQTTLMFQFLKKHPEISKLELAKKREVFKALLAD